MCITSDYYSVTVNPDPFKRDNEREVGWYQTRPSAEFMANLIRSTFEHQIASGISIDIHPYRGKMICTPMGLRLEETPNGAITLVQQDISGTEMERILSFTAVVLRSKLKISPGMATGYDEPTAIYEGLFHSIVIDFFPFNRSKHIVAGYYQSYQTAHTVVMFILNAHTRNKVGFGFDTTIEAHQGKFVEYKSGKRFVKIDGQDHEIQASCSHTALLQIFSSLNLAIQESTNAN